MKEWKTYFFYSKLLRAVKIGKTTQTPQQRLDQFLTAVPDYTVVGFLEGDREREFHQRFASLRIDQRRELFRAGGDLTRFLRSQFNYRKLPYKTSEAPDKSYQDAQPLILHEVCERAQSAIISHDAADDFDSHCRDLVNREYPECNRVYCECEEICEPLGEFWGALDLIESLWKQIFGYSFRRDDSYFRLFCAFWLPTGRLRSERLLDNVSHIEWALNENDGPFAFDSVFIDASGNLLESDDVYFALHPKRKAEYDRWVLQEKDRLERGQPSILQEISTNLFTDQR
jgi:hypothetical protein